MAKIEEHVREYRHLTGRWERPALQWLASKTPARFGPDTLTIIGIIGSLVIFAGYALSNQHPGYLWLASFGFAVNWLGDSLDGTLARYRKTERPKYGFFVDHTVDVGSEALVFIGLGVSPFARLDIALLGLVGYMSMSVYVYVRTAVDGVFKLGFGGFGPTEARLLVVAANTAVFFFGNPSFEVAGQVLTPLDLLLGGIALVMGTMFLFVSARYAFALRDIGE